MMVSDDAPKETYYQGVVNPQQLLRSIAMER